MTSDTLPAPVNPAGKEAQNRRDGGLATLTPEERAAAPTHRVVILPDPENIAAVDRMLASMRLMIRERREMEWPKGHPERPGRTANGNGGEP